MPINGLDPLLVSLIIRTLSGTGRTEYKVLIISRQRCSPHSQSLKTPWSYWKELARHFERSIRVQSAQGVSYRSIDFAMAGRFFTAATLFAAAFASSSVYATTNSTASNFTYDATDEVSNTPATDTYGKQYQTKCTTMSLTSTSDPNRDSSRTIWWPTCICVPSWICMAPLGLRHATEVITA